MQQDATKKSIIIITCILILGLAYIGALLLKAHYNNYVCAKEALKYCQYILRSKVDSSFYITSHTLSHDPVKRTYTITLQAIRPANPAKDKTKKSIKAKTVCELEDTYRFANFNGQTQRLLYIPKFLFEDSLHNFSMYTEKALFLDSVSGS